MLSIFSPFMVISGSTDRVWAWLHTVIWGERQPRSPISIERGPSGLQQGGFFSLTSLFPVRLITAKKKKKGHITSIVGYKATTTHIFGSCSRFKTRWWTGCCCSYFPSQNPPASFRNVYNYLLQVVYPTGQWFLYFVVHIKSVPLQCINDSCTLK